MYISFCLIKKLVLFPVYLKLNNVQRNIKGKLNVSSGSYKWEVFLLKTLTRNIEFSFIVSGSERTYTFGVPLYWWLMIFFTDKKLKLFWKCHTDMTILCFWPFPSFWDLILMTLSSGTPSLHVKILKKQMISYIIIKNWYSLYSTQIKISEQCSLLFFKTFLLC